MSKNFAYSKLVKIILVCINKLPLYIRVERNYKNFLEELSLKQLAKFLDMTKVIVR